MDAFNLKPSELEVLKSGILAFMYNIFLPSEGHANTNAEIAVLPEVIRVLLEHTGIIRLDGKQLRTVKNALCKAEYEMTTTNGLVATDRPDVPLTDDTSWTIDYSETLKAINDAISILDTSVYSRREIRV